MVIYDGPLDNELEGIGKKFNITKTDLQEIKSEAILIILKINKLEALGQNLADKTSLDKQNLQIITREIIDKVISPIEIELTTSKHPDKDVILDEIENPVPVKPIVQNPAGKNTILDAQHNLPEQAKKVLISSASVPSRGPILGTLKPNVVLPPTPSVSPAPQQNPVVAQPTQPQKPPQAPTPPAPPAQDKYTVDPYREPLE
jgi:hypothetical protein